MRFIRILLVAIAVVCFGVALSYPIRYYLAQKSNDSNMEQLAEMRSRVREEAEGPSGTADAPANTDGPDEAEIAPAEAAPGENGSEAADTQASADGEALSQGEAVGNVQRADASDEADPEEQLPRFPAKPTIPPEAKEAAEGEASPGDAATPTPGEAGGDEPISESDRDAEGATPEKTLSEPIPEADRDAEGATPEQAASEPTPGAVVTPTPEPTPTPDPYYWELSRYLGPTPTPTPKPTEGPTATPTPVPTPTPDRSIRTGPLPYTLKDKVTLDEAAILPELRDIYALNNDLVGWVTIPDTVIDYPVVQCDDPDFYLSHDFYGEENNNGQIILDPLCDPYTPSYNLILSGHHMKSGSMFGNLPEYRTKGYWEKHKFLEFDSLMERKQFVIFAAFYSADYDEDEKGFRYNANLVYKIDVTQWLAEVAENQLYDTGVEAEFGDEFITLTTCNRARHRNGRFVVVCRRIREGETFE